MQPEHRLTGRRLALYGAGYLAMLLVGAVIAVWLQQNAPLVFWLSPFVIAVAIYVTVRRRWQSDIRRVQALSKKAYFGRPLTDADAAARKRLEALAAERSAERRDPNA